MNPLLRAGYALALFATGGWAQSPVTVTIGPDLPVPALQSDFLGLSFGMKTLPPDQGGGHFFSPTNTPLVRLFQNIGIKHLRLGGTTVEWPASVPIPDRTDIDSLFAFAQAAGVEKVIYSFRLLETLPDQHYAATNAALARYIWDHHRAQLDLFALGNEPDRRKVYEHDPAITNFETYLQRWRAMAAAITEAVPGAKFAGPDAGSGNVVWTTRFADAEKNSSLIQLITEHFYVGGAGRGKTAEQGLEAMLSPDWVGRNERLHERVTRPVATDGLAFRFTEASDHYSGGIHDASDTFAGALWALDFLHWWAAHGARGVDFHNTQWVANDVITYSDGRLSANPKAYGLKAFSLSCDGRPAAVQLDNPQGLNLTAYAVRNRSELFLTVINKEHGAAARAAVLKASAKNLGNAEAMFLSAPNSEVTAKTGITFGGAALSASTPWSGKWQPLLSAVNGQATVTVAAASAAVVRFHEPSD